MEGIFSRVDLSTVCTKQSTHKSAFVSSMATPIRWKRMTPWWRGPLSSSSQCIGQLLSASPTPCPCLQPSFPRVSFHPAHSLSLSISALPPLPLAHPKQTNPAMLLVSRRETQHCWLQPTLGGEIRYLIYSRSHDRQSAGVRLHVGLLTAAKKMNMAKAVTSRQTAESYKSTHAKQQAPV